MSKQRNETIVGIDMKPAPLQSKEEMETDLGPKLAMVGIVIMIIYLVIAQ